MLRQFLLLSGVALSLSAFAASEKVALQPQANDASKVMTHQALSKNMIMAERNVGQSVKAPARKAAANSVHWKRPAGQFWGTGYSEDTKNWYYFTPLLVRPWVDYSFENLSTVQGTPTWTIPFITGQDAETGELTYDYETSNEESIMNSYLYYEYSPAPELSYNGQVPYPTMYLSSTETGRKIGVLACESITPYFGVSMPVSSHYWSIFSRNQIVGDDQGITMIGGATPYEGMQTGAWFGTNNSGINAMATRFEKPLSPYLLDGVRWFYASTGPITKEIPLTAFVFKTSDDAAPYETSSGIKLEGLELGDLIAVSQAVVPVCTDEKGAEGTVSFKFVERNPVTGAESEISLEIEDDITILVTGFDANTENGTIISSLISLDDIDEGYGNLGFLGTFEVSDDGRMGYNLVAIKDFFDGGGFGNTTLGVLADVTYPWLVNMYDDPDLVKLPNEGTTTENFQGLEYAVYFMSTSETSDYEITYNGEDECDWLSVVDVYDDYQENPYTGEEEFTGRTAIEFQAAPNPDDISRTCVVKISIPAASYTFTLYQGSNNNAVELVGVDEAPVYYDLQGRRVVNPEKGIYFKKIGNKAEKVLL